MKSAAFHAAQWSPWVATPEGEVRWLTIRAGFMTESPSQRFIYCLKLMQPLETPRTTLSTFRLVGLDDIAPVTLGRAFPDCYHALRWIEASFLNA